jgi:hypothetical protein
MFPSRHRRHVGTAAHAVVIKTIVGPPTPLLPEVTLPQALPQPRKFVTPPLQQVSETSPKSSGTVYNLNNVAPNWELPISSNNIILSGKQKSNSRIVISHPADASVTETIVTNNSEDSIVLHYQGKICRLKQGGDAIHLFNNNGISPVWQIAVKAGTPVIVVH